MISNSDAAILPGVGAFNNAMDNLARLDLISTIKEFIKIGKPFMGICLGMQLLFSKSEEFGLCEGLNILQGSVIRFSNSVDGMKPAKVPHVGWNQIIHNSSLSESSWLKTPLNDINEGEYMYFVHSFYCIPESKNIVLSLTNYGGTEYCSSILYRNVFATQFHPERSGPGGLAIYRNWAECIN